MSKAPKQKKTEIDRKPSTDQFISAAVMGFFGFLELPIGVFTIVSGNPFQGSVYLGLGVFFLWMANRNLRMGMEIRNLAKNEPLLAAAVYEAMLNTGKSDGILKLNLDADGTVSDGTHTPQKTTGRLNELREARKGPNASD